jgi:hypothetical protein
MFVPGKPYLCLILAYLLPFREYQCRRPKSSITSASRNPTGLSTATTTTTAPAGQSDTSAERKPHAVGNRTLPTCFSLAQAQFKSGANVIKLFTAVNSGTNSVFLCLSLSLAWTNTLDYSGIGTV